MFKISKRSLTAALILVVGCLLLGVKFFVDDSRKVPQQTSPTKLPSRAKGNPQASIQIIEFIDFQCPACAKGYQLLHDYLEKNSDKIYIELRYFPLTMHKHGRLTAQLGECAARQQKFWPFMDLLIARQSQWAPMSDPTAVFETIEKEAGLDSQQIQACFKDGTADKVIQADIDEGQMRAVMSTPTYFINHEMVVGVKSLQSKLDGLLGVKTPEGKQKP